MILRHDYENKLRTIHEKILFMGILIEEAFRKALKALKVNDNKLAREVMDEDKKIDDLQTEIEDDCVKIIAMEAPVATDLRIVITTLKIVSELERIGDHARHLAKMIGKLSDKQLTLAMPYISNMINAGLDMIKDALKAFVEKDASLAEEVARRDDFIDKQHRELYKTCVNMIKTSPEKLDQEIPLLFLNRFLERIGDRVTNICEWIIYAKQGKRLDLN